MQTQVVIVNGNLSDGFNIIGPFENFENAIEYAENNIKNEQWWIIKLENPYNRNIPNEI